MKKVLIAVRIVCALLFAVYAIVIMLVWNMISFIVSMLLGLFNLLFLADPIKPMFDLYETISQDLRYQDITYLLKSALHHGGKNDIVKAKTQ